ncbi:MAG: hypothetical protein LBT90_01290 [Holosporaceae bacterium]|nr:hypothetical protein [Holosporaceae bacterium]
MKRNIFAVFGAFCVYGASEGMDWKCVEEREKTNIEYPISDIVQGVVPQIKDVQKYVEIYKLDKEDSISFQAGVLAAKCYMDNKRYEDAGGILFSILPVVVSSAELAMYFCRFLNMYAWLLDLQKDKKISAEADIVKIIKAR